MFIVIFVFKQSEKASEHGCSLLRFRNVRGPKCPRLRKLKLRIRKMSKIHFRQLSKGLSKPSLEKLTWSFHWWTFLNLKLKKIIFWGTDFDSIYHLAKQSCGGDIGSVPYVCVWVRTYVRSFVRSFVCSPGLATSFIIQFRYNFTQVLDMTIPRTSSRFSVIGSRSRSQWLFLEKLCHHSSAFIY